MPFFTTGMITEELLDFLRTQHKSGMSRDEMITLLTQEGGWTLSDIDEGFRMAGLQEFATPRVTTALPVTHDAVAIKEAAVPDIEFIPNTPPPAILDVAFPDHGLSSPAVISDPKEHAILEVQTAAFRGDESLAFTDAPVGEGPKLTDDFLGIFAPHPEVVEERTADEVPTPSIAAQVNSAPPLTSEQVGPPSQLSTLPPAPGWKAPQPIISREPQSRWSLEGLLKDPATVIPPGSASPAVNKPPVVALKEVSPIDDHIIKDKTQIIPEERPAVEEPLHFDLSKLREATSNVSSENIAAPLAPPVTATTLVAQVPPTPSPAGEVTKDAYAGPVHLRIEKEGVAPKTSELTAPATEKIVETRPISQLWIENAEKHVDSAPRSLETHAVITDAPLQPPPIVDTPKAVVTPAPKVAQAFHGAIPRKRTMASDMLMRSESNMAKPVAEPPPTLPDHPIAAPTPPSTGESQSRTPLLAFLKRTSEVPSQQKVISAPPVSSSAEDIKHKNDVKRVMRFALIILAALLSVSALVGAFFWLRGPNISSELSSAGTSFFSASSFSYEGESSADITLSTSVDGVVQNGLIKFALSYIGQTQNGAQGLGDGLHQVNFSGGLKAGTFEWSTDIKSDIRKLSNALYFHVLALPGVDDIDMDMLNIYWIKLSIADIASKLGLTGVAATESGYGNFGGDSIDNSLRALFAAHPPFHAGEMIGNEVIGGVEALHFSLAPNPDSMVDLYVALYRKYAGKQLTFTEEERLRLAETFAKVKADTWVDPTTHDLLQISLTADIDDDIVGAHARGTFAWKIRFFDYEKPVKVSAPSLFLTFEEANVRTEDYKKTKLLREKDAAKIEEIRVIEDALALYKGGRGKYPAQLGYLRFAGGLSTSTYTDTVLNNYFYASYLKQDMLTKSARCTPVSKTCTFYHLGVNLEDMNNPALTSDADLTTEIRGSDSRGCGGEADISCYDVVAPTTAATSTQAIDPPKNP